MLRNLCWTLEILKNVLLSLLPRYPYESVRVVTEDGYVLLMERIPRYATYRYFLNESYIFCIKFVS